MDIHDMTREELISYIEEMKAKRAFSYEDQMKLLILDGSPLTVWASDKNFLITLWEGQCESLYGYSKAEAIGKNYIDLFVAPDEKFAARRDHYDIIDNAAVFHNIANDIGKNGNTLQLVTICRRIRDPRSGEYWNAELGIIIDYLEQEKERLKLVIAESQRISLCVRQFIESTGQLRRQLVERRKMLNSSIRTHERRAIARNRRTEFRRAVLTIKDRADTILNSYDSMVEEYYSYIQTCATFEECENTRHSFLEKYDELSDALEDIVLDFDDIAHEYDSHTDNLISVRDSLMRSIGDQERALNDLANRILDSVEGEIADYRSSISSTPDPNSEPYRRFLVMKDKISACKEEATAYIVEITDKASKISVEDEIHAIKTEMMSKFNLWLRILRDIEQQLRG